MFVRRYSGIYAAIILFVFTAALNLQGTIGWIAPACFGALVLLGARDLIQQRHSILRNYPLLGHFRFFFEAVRPELRQYIVESDTEEAPFSRAQRSIVYQRSKNDVDSRAFGTELNVRETGHEWISHSIAPTTIASQDFRIVVGAGREKPYLLSVFNISAMSFGALSANAIRALNLGAKKGNFAHDTGEGSLSPYHRENQGDLIWEIGSGYFGCRNEDGSFDEVAFASRAQEPQVKMIEVKLSQGAKPGHGGVLPGAKVTREIAETRGVPVGVDCISPAAHTAFDSLKGLLHFIEQLRNLSGGKPTGFKLCIGAPEEFFGIVKAMLETGITPDFIVVDGAEGGTGAAPLEFVDHVGTPLQEGLVIVHNGLVGAGLRDKVRIGASGKLITAFDIARTLALGADWVNSARGFMFAIGCIQAQKCNTDRCPTAVATQDRDRQAALVVPDKAERVFNFHRNTLHALKELLQASGLAHPSDLTPEHVMRRVSAFETKPLSELVERVPASSFLTGESLPGNYAKWWVAARSETFSRKSAILDNSSEKKVFWCKPAPAEIHLE